MRVLFILCLFGCVTSENHLGDDLRVMQRGEISALIRSEMRPRDAFVDLGDNKYSVFKDEHSFKLILNEYTKYTFDSGLRYSKKYDCEDYARGMLQFFQVRYSRSKHKGESFAVGVINYMHRSNSAHAICVAVTEQGILFIEPRTGFVKELTEQEKRSIYLVIF